MNHMQPQADSRYIRKMEGPPIPAPEPLDPARREFANLLASHATGPARAGEGPPDHLSVGGAINLLRTDVNQLLQEIEELRARLSPVLKEDKVRQDRGRERNGLPMLSAMAGELEAIHSTVAQARECVYYTLAQLDL